MIDGKAGVVGIPFFDSYVEKATIYFDNGAVTGGYDGPIELSKHQQFQWLREELGKDGFNLPVPTGN